VLPADGLSITDVKTIFFGSLLVIMIDDLIVTDTDMLVISEDVDLMSTRCQHYMQPSAQMNILTHCVAQPLH